MAASSADARRSGSGEPFIDLEVEAAAMMRRE